MGRTCTICSSAAREEIDEALVRGESYRSVAKRFEASAPAVFRHRDHLPKALAKAQEAREVAHADDLLGQVRDLGERALRVLAAAEALGDLRAATGAIREARGCLEFLGKVTGELFERHAHLHAVAPEPEPVQMRPFTELEERVLRLIAHRRLLRNPADPGREPRGRSLEEELRELVVAKTAESPTAEVTDRL